MHLQLSSYKDAILGYLNDQGARNGHPMGNGATTLMGGKDSMSMLTLSDSERPSQHDYHQTQNHNSVRSFPKRFYRALSWGPAINDVTLPLLVRSQFTEPPILRSKFD